MSTDASAPWAAAMPSASRRRSSSTAVRVRSETVRMVPVITAVSGMTLVVVPARILATVTTAGWKASIRRVSHGVDVQIVYLELDPQSVVALGAMAELAYRRGDAFEARAFSQRRLAAGPVDARALQLASQIEQKLGDRAAAERYTRRMRAEFGDHPAQAGDQ